MPSHCILVTGYFDRGNLGDNAMRDALASFLADQAPGTQVEWRPLPDASLKKIREAASFLYRLTRADVVVLAGGTHFHDRFGLRSARILLTFIAIFSFARVFRTKVGLLGIGLGPLATKWGRKLTHFVLRLSSCTVVRDHDSFILANELGSGKSTVEGSDLAMTLFVPPKCRSASSTVIGLNVVSYFGVYGGVSGTDGEYVRSIASALEAVKHNYPNFTARVLLCCVSVPDGDEAISRELDEALRSRGIRSDIVTCTNYSEAIHEIGQLDLLIANRYHAMVLGFLAERPMIAIPYQEKCRSLATQIGLPSNAIISPEFTLETRLFEELISDALSSPATYRPTTSPELLRTQALSSLTEFAALLRRQPA